MAKYKSWLSVALVASTLALPGFAENVDNNSGHKPVYHELLTGESASRVVSAVPLERDLAPAIKDYDSGKLVAALSLFHAAIGNNPKDAVAHYYCANTLLRLGQDAEAEKEYRAAYSLSPNGPIATYCRQAIHQLGCPSVATVGHPAPQPAAPCAVNQDQVEAQKAAIAISQQATSAAHSIEQGANAQAQDRITNGNIISDKIQTATAQKVAAMNASGMYWNRWWNYYGQYSGPQQPMFGNMYYGTDGWAGLNIQGYSGGYNQGRNFTGGTGYNYTGMSGRFIGAPDGRNPAAYTPDPMEDTQASWMQQANPTSYVQQAGNLQAGIVRQEAQSQADAIRREAAQREATLQQESSALINRMNAPASYGGIRLAPQGTNLYVQNYVFDSDAPQPPPQVVRPLTATAKSYPLLPPPKLRRASKSGEAVK